MQNHSQFAVGSLKTPPRVEQVRIRPRSPLPFLKRNDHFTRHREESMRTELLAPTHALHGCCEKEKDIVNRHIGVQMYGLVRPRLGGGLGQLGLELLVTLEDLIVVNDPTRRRIIGREDS